MKNAPPGYQCPFCGIAETLPSPAPESAVVLVDANVFALVPTHHYAGTKGNCLVIPRRHYENVLDGPAGNQDVWHYHLHVFPRYSNDGLHAGPKAPYTTGERIELAASLRAALRYSTGAMGNQAL